MAKRQTHLKMIGTIPDSVYYHRSGHGAPLWAGCEPTMLTERLPEDEDFRFEDRGLLPCWKCWPPGSRVSNA